MARKTAATSDSLNGVRKGEATRVAIMDAPSGSTFIRGSAMKV